MSWLCMELEDYRNNPDGNWHRVDLAYDRESAARIFMEESADPFGRFGKGESSRREMGVLVWDEIEDRVFLVNVMPEPSPGYLCEELDADEILDLDFKIEEVEKPGYARISQ